jgi:hypothetical protein
LVSQSREGRRVAATAVLLPDCIRCAELGEVFDPEATTGGGSVRIADT